MTARRRQQQRAAPLHQRILGKSQVEIDLIDDLTDELEKAYSLDLIEYDQYLDCHAVLDMRRDKASKALARALGRAQVGAPPTVEYRQRRAPVRQGVPLSIKIGMMLCALLLFKYVLNSG